MSSLSIPKFKSESYYNQQQCPYVYLIDYCNNHNNFLLGQVLVLNKLLGGFLWWQLLEEYLTEAGLRALDADDGDDTGDATPNFAELALLLQQSTSIYSRKVDYLHQHVLLYSESLYNSQVSRSAHRPKLAGSSAQDESGKTDLPWFQRPK